MKLLNLYIKLKLVGYVISSILFILFILMFTFGCGTEVIEGVPGPQGPEGKSEPKSVSLEGYYELPNGGYIDILEDSQGLLTIRTARLVFVNADGTTGVLPLTTLVATASFEGSLFNNANQTYVALTHNIKQDSNNTVLVGSFLTELKFYKDGNGSLNVKAIVTNSTTVVFSHTIVE